MNIFITFLNLTTEENDDDLVREKIIKEMIKKFEPGEKYLNAETYITTIIDNSHDTIATGIMDSLYQYAKYLR